MYQNTFFFQRCIES